MSDSRDGYGKLRALIANRMGIGADDARDIADAIQVLIDVRITAALETVRDRLLQP